MLKLPTKWEWLAVILIILAFTIVAAPISDQGYGRFRIFQRICLSNLNGIGWNIAIYKIKHNGKVPPSVVKLVQIIDGKKLLQCPWNHESSYLYRPSENPKEIICWDDAPHIYSGFWWRKPVNKRNVLYGNGKVEAMEESKFQKLGLRGTRIVPPKQ